MAAVALIALVLWGLLAVGLRALIQLRRTGSTGIKGVSGSPGSAEWLGGVLFVVANAILVAAPVLALAGTVEPIGVFDTTPVNAVGVVLFALGLAGTLAAQLAMGASWRIGVDEEERTQLVQDGPFALVRNPIYSAMLPSVVGVALMVPSVVAFAGLVTMLIALELQVRVVEEPYLLDVHGDEYARYAARVGRFVPGLGLLRSA